MDARRFVELLGLGQGLPGPTSTQMVVAVGTARAGPLGGLLAFFCFLYPAVIVMALAGLGVAQFLSADNRPVWLDGVGAGAVALVAQAAWRLGRVVVNTRLTMGLMLFGAAVAVLWRQPWIFPAALAAGGLVTALALRGQQSQAVEETADRPLANLGISPVVGGLLLALFFGLLGGLIVARAYFDWTPLALAESYYRMGSLVFGGGQVVLPMMLTEVVTPGWVTEEEFLDGFRFDAGVAGTDVQLQRVPGRGALGSARRVDSLRRALSAGDIGDLRGVALLGESPHPSPGEFDVGRGQCDRHRTRGSGGVSSLGPCGTDTGGRGDCPAGVRGCDVFSAFPPHWPSLAQGFWAGYSTWPECKRGAGR